MGLDPLVHALYCVLLDTKLPADPAVIVTLMKYMPILINKEYLQRDYIKNLCGALLEKYGVEDA